MHGIRSSELKRKFQAALPDSQINDSKVSATSARYPVSNFYCDEEGKRTEQTYWGQEPPPLPSEVARAIRQIASRKTTGPYEVPAKLFKAGGEKECTEYVWRSGKLMSGQRNGRSPRLSHFPRKMILNSVQITEHCSCVTCKQDPSSDHTGKDPSEDGKGNCR